MEWRENENENKKRRREDARRQKVLLFDSQFLYCKSLYPFIPLHCATGRKTKSLVIIFFQSSVKPYLQNSKERERRNLQPKKKQTNKQCLYSGGMVWGEEEFLGRIYLSYEDRRIRIRNSLSSFLLLVKFNFFSISSFFLFFFFFSLRFMYISIYTSDILL